MSKGGALIELPRAGCGIGVRERIGGEASDVGCAVRAGAGVVAGVASAHAVASSRPVPRKRDLPGTGFDHRF
jgi:hypothetical protein